MSTSHHAFTLVELLVVIATLGTLVALSLPAMQSVREASRRAACSNNLRQIGLAIRLHHESEGHFPVGGIEWRPAGDPRKRQLAWSAFILPYLEQQTIYDQLDLAQAFDSQANRIGAAQVIETYLCPTGIHTAADPRERGPCDYGGIIGERIQSPNQPPKGILVYDRTFTDADVRDGLSYTLIVGEDTAWADGEWINGRNLFDQAFAINRAPAFENDLRSGHPGGAQGVMADASVRFLPSELDLQVLAGLCTRAGKEVIPPLP